MTVTCPLCKEVAPIRRGRVAPHNYTIRTWAQTARGESVMADLVVTCTPRIRVVRP